MPSLIDQSGNLDYWGRLSWANFVDWLVTACLGVILALSAVLLGCARPDTHAFMLPLFACLIGLHGLWLALREESFKRLSHVPLYFIPFLLWMWLNLFWVSSTVWRGWYECIYALEAFIFLWILVNNVCTRAHLWVLLTIALLPATYAIFNGFFQFFQNPSKLANAYAHYDLRLSREFWGQATGSFADPNSFAVFLLMLVPSLLIAGWVPRLPLIVRVLCLYVAAMFVTAIFFTQVFWALLLLMIIFLLVPWGCFLKRSKRVWSSLIGLLGSLLAIGGFLWGFKERTSPAMVLEGEAVRWVVWQEALRMILDAPLTGIGAGSFSTEFEQSTEVSLAKLPLTAQNDYLLILAEYGVIGGCLLLLPSAWVVWWSFRCWRAEPARLKLRHGRGTIMPPTKFFLSIALGGVLSFALCLFGSFVFYIPALTLYGVLFFSILIKSSCIRKLHIPLGGYLGTAYFCVALGLACGFYWISAPRIQAQALELHARQRLDQIVEQRVHLSGNPALLDEVIELYTSALRLDPNNADAWIGLSAANGHLFFRKPGNYEQIAMRSSEYARQAIELSEHYWMAWAQLGIAEALRGNYTEAESALIRALDLAPNSSNAHYYWAAYMSHFNDRRAEAIAAVQRALEINPDHVAARRLQQKLRIL